LPNETATEVPATHQGSDKIWSMLSHLSALLAKSEGGTGEGFVNVDFLSAYTSFFLKCFAIWHGASIYENPIHR
jgi:hypothetical protein